MTTTKIILPGGSRPVGTVVSRAFHADGHEVVVLGRSPTPAPWRTEARDAATLGARSATLDGVVVNLNGRGVNRQHTPANRRAIMDSRADPTRPTVHNDLPGRPGPFTMRA